MSISTAQELALARKLLDEDRYQETLDILTEFEKKEGISTEDQIECLLIKGELNYILGKYDLALSLAENAFQISKEKENPIYIFNSLYLKLKGRCEIFRGIRGDASSISSTLTSDMHQLKNIYFLLNDLSLKLQMKIDANYNLANGLFNSLIEGGEETALDFYNKYIAICEKLDNKAEIAESFWEIARFFFRKGDLKQSSNYLVKTLTFKEIRKWHKIATLFLLGFISNNRGELDQAIAYTNEAYDVNHEVNNPGLSVNINLNLGFNSRLKGDLEQALTYYKKTLALYDEYGVFPTLKGYTYFSIIRTYIDKGSYEEAKRYLIDLRQYVDQAINKHEERWYHLSEGLVLKSSSNLRDRFKAENIFKELIESKIHTPNFINIAMLHLCDLLLLELRRTNDLNVLEELNPLIANYIKNAEFQESFWHLADAKILQAKLALIQMNMGEARRLLTEAQLIADEHGLGILAQKISSEHDTLLEQLSRWEELKEKNAPVSKRIELSSFDDVIERLLEKRTVEQQKIVDEEPVLLLIIAEGGVLLFSYPFTEDWSRDNELFGSFLSAITSFSDEFFSEDVDRFKFGQHTVLIEVANKFSIYYLFKGQTYLAKQKLKYFNEKIQGGVLIQQTFEKYLQTSQVIELKDFPFLEPFIMDIFTTKVSKSNG